MLDIDQKIFSENLLLTQQYCERQLANTEKNFASILRSINPEEDGQKMFKFSLFEIRAEPPFYTFEATWHVDLFTPNLLEDLFEQQIAIKQSQKDHAQNLDLYKGDILAFKVDSTLIDGGSVVYSHGFFDYFDCPPIDTWFYLTKEGNSRVLLAWIPLQLVKYAQDGIDSNTMDCLEWFKIWYPTNSSLLH